jgi:signal transduction histidine kinase
VGAFWYYFAVSYTGGTLRGICKYLPVTLSAMHYLLVLTNVWHHLYYTEFTTERVIHGPFFYTNVVMTYTFVIVGAVILYRHMEKGTMAKTLVVTSVLVPVAFNAIYLTGLVQSLFDITPLGFAVSIFLTLLATVKYQFIDLRRELAITSEKLLLEQERNRIAQQVHDTTGHTLTMIQSYMKLAEMSVKNEEPDKTKEYLADARTLTSQGIRELRESINQLRKEASYELLTQGIMQLAAQVKEIPVEVTIRGEDSERYSHLSRVLYDTTREAITNSLKYAESTKIEIVVRFQGKSVELVIGDDGKGCEVIRENNGIRGIRERVEQAGGTVRFLSSAGEGFLIRVKIPV